MLKEQKFNREAKGGKRLGRGRLFMATRMTKYI
jgi:hypothetical protein